MNKVEKSLLDTDIISEIIKRANPRIIAKANSYLNQFDKYTLSVIQVFYSVLGVCWGMSSNQFNTLLILTLWLFKPNVGKD